MLCRGQPDSGEGCIVLKADKLIASLLSFCMFSHRLQYVNFVLQGKRPWKGVCEWTFDAWCHGTQSTSEQSQLCKLSRPTFRFTTQEFSIVGSYTENPEKPQTWLSKLGGGRLPGTYGKTVVTCSFSITIQVLLLTALLTLDEALVLFFSTMWHAMVMKVDWLAADMTLSHMTVDIMKMLVFAAKVGILDNERYSNIIDQVNTPIDRQVLRTL